jgi:hypothetical protein
MCPILVHPLFSPAQAWLWQYKTFSSQETLSDIIVIGNKPTIYPP